MKRQYKSIRYTVITLASVLIGMIIATAVTTSAEADDAIAKADAIMEEHHARYYSDFSLIKHNDTHRVVYSAEPETVNLSYSDWQETQKMDVWEMGLQYDISELDTTRTLKLITLEGYENSILSYYVACCCLVRATEGYWGYNNLYQAFGEADTSYDEWMDGIEIADWAYDYLRMAYEQPTYCKYCNGMTVPAEYIYCENGIYCWN